MRISELIERLQILKEKYGDLPVSYVENKKCHTINYVDYRAVTKSFYYAGPIEYRWIFLSDELVDLRDYI